MIKNWSVNFTALYNPLSVSKSSNPYFKFLFALMSAYKVTDLNI